MTKILFFGNLSQKAKRKEKEMRLEEQLKERRERLESVLEETLESIKTAPEGRLRVSVNGDYARFYRLTSKGDRSGKYISAKNHDLITQLAQKDYDVKVSEKIKNELNVLDMYDDAFSKGTFEDVFDSLNDQRKKLVIPRELPDDEYVQQWLAYDYEKMGFRVGEPIYETDIGIKVRSKSEVLISNKLNKEKIPQLYEVPLKLEGYGTVRPDFKILNVRTRKEFIWEHFGMLEDREYLLKCLRKIEAYIANGYIPGVNLIITFESEHHPLNLRTVDRIIDELLK